MPANSYHLVSHWRAQGTVADVADILGDAVSLPRWWGSVYREVEQIDAGDEQGLGRIFTVRAKGWLPYSLALRFRQTAQRYPNGFTVAVSGDLNGGGVWSFEQDGPDVDISFDWTVQADKAILRRFSALLKPVFASNHHWTMRRGEESLRVELARRQAHTPEERAQVPAPPQPFASRPLLLATAGLAALAGAATIVYRVLSRRD